jgi:alkylhydroperoxidase family enzyme
MAHSPASLQRFYELARCLWGGGLGARAIEVAILSTVSIMGARYPLAWHVGDGRDAGLTDPEIHALVHGEAAGLDEADAAVASFARQLTAESAVSDGAFAAVSARMDERQIVELVLLVGLYNLVGRVANALQVDLDPAAGRLLEELETRG